MAASTNKDEQKRIDSIVEKNRRLKKKVDALSYQCSMQSKILNSGNLSSLQVLLDHVMAFVSSHLKKIQIELLYTEYDARDTIALYRFREFLLSIYTQLGSFLVMTEGLVHVELRRVQDKHAEIGNILDRLNGMPSDVMAEILDEQDRLYEHILQVTEDSDDESL